MDKVNNVIDILKDMTFINKLRFGVCVFSSNYLNFKYDKNKYYKQYDGLLRKWDDEYSLWIFIYRFNIFTNVDVTKYYME